MYIVCAAPTRAVETEIMYDALQKLAGKDSPHDGKI